MGFSRPGIILERFIEKTGLPFILMNYGRGELPDEHPQSIWDCGNLGLTVALQQADVLLVAGLRFNWLLQSGELIPRGPKLCASTSIPTNWTGTGPST